MHLSAIKDVLPDSKLDEDLGLCSFDVMAIICDIERSKKVSVDISKFKSGMTVSEFFEAISK